MIDPHLIDWLLADSYRLVSVYVRLSVCSRLAVGHSVQYGFRRTPSADASLGHLGQSCLRGHWVRSGHDPVAHRCTPGSDDPCYPPRLWGLLDASPLFQSKGQTGYPILWSRGWVLSSVRGAVGTDRQRWWQRVHMRRHSETGFHLLKQNESSGGRDQSSGAGSKRCELLVRVSRSVHRKKPRETFAVRSFVKLCNQV